MKINLNELSDKELTADFAIVGGGTVGLLVATELARSLPQKKIIVLESGNEFIERSDLFDVEFIKSKYAGASHGRFRCLGGTSNRWGGAMIPMLKRDWDHLDFGFDLSELDVFINRLEEIFGLDRGGFTGDKSEHWLGKEYMPRIGKWPAFKFRNTKNIFKFDIDELPNLSVCVNSHVVGFSSAPTRVFAIDSDNTELKVNCSKIIICAGAIESTRLALIFNKQARIKLPSLGDNFSDHLSLTIGDVKIRNKREKSEFNHKFGFRFGSQGSFRNIRFELNESSELRESIPPHYIHFSWRPDPKGGFSILREIFQKLQLGKLPKLSELLKMLPFSWWLLKAAYWRYLKKRVLFDDNATLHVDVLLEQKPSKSNQIRLGKTLDCYGQKKVSICWAVQEADLTNLELIVSNLCEIWKSSPIASLGEFQRYDQTQIRDSLFSNGGSYHPTGTTPLGSLENGGCIDSDFYLHGSSELQILSTSTFPSGGGSNPTMMLLLMGLKCVAKHVQQSK